MTKIDKKIVSYSVVKAEEQETAVVSDVQQMHESVARPDVLHGTTYKIKTPLSDHALYITINDMLLNGGTQHAHRRPFEIFINSKAMENFQWIVSITRIISAVFRKGGDCTFLVDELRSVFDPKGGYFKKGGKYMPSLVAEIGEVIETHLKSIGMIEVDDLDAAQKQFIKEKRTQYENNVKIAEETTDNGYPPEATLCVKCNTKAVVIIQGCSTCLCCAESRCG